MWENKAIAIKDNFDKAKMYYRFLGTVATLGVSSFFFKLARKPANTAATKTSSGFPLLADQLVNIQYLRDQWSDRIVA